MKQMLSRSFNKMKELKEFVNDEKIAQEDIVQIFPELDKSYTIIYYAE